MPISLQRNSKKGRAWGRGSVFNELVGGHIELVGIIACAARFAFLPFDVLTDGPVLCPIQRFTEHPCPTCGVTRSVHCLAQGEFSRAWELNPAGFLVVLAAVKHASVLALKTKSWTRFLSYRFLDLTILVGFFGLGFLRHFGVL